jgi:leader peptidase (prepilin peptidase)/N-methyltransferase
MLPLSLWHGTMRHGMSFEVSWRLASLLDSFMGAALGAAFIYGAGFVYLKWKGVEGMGFGDVKLMAMIGSFLGMRMTILIIFLAAMSGAVFGLSIMLVVWRKRLRRRLQRGKEPAAVARRRAWQSASLLYRQYEIPFGSFLGSVALLMLFYGDTLVRWYMRLYGIYY